MLTEVFAEKQMDNSLCSTIACLKVEEKREYTSRMCIRKLRGGGTGQLGRGGGREGAGEVKKEEGRERENEKIHYLSKS